MKLWNISMKIGDPMWIMPLWEPMKSAIKASAVADLVNAAEGLGHPIPYYPRLHPYNFYPATVSA